jgi:hypothetical protein
VKPYVTALSVMTVFVGASLAFGRQGKDLPYKYQKDEQVYAELGKAPEKPAISAIRWSTTPMPGGRGKTYSNATARNATVTRPKGEKRGPASARQRSRTPDRGRFSGF